MRANFHEEDNRITQAAQIWICERTVGIYQQRPDGNPTIEGSGVLLQIAEVAFLLSASHVLEAAQQSRILLVPMTNGSRPIRLPLEAPIHISPDQETVDIGFARLPDEVAHELARHGKRFLRLSDLELVNESTSGLYSVVGYPLIANTPNHDTRTINARPFCYGTYLCVEPVDNFKPGTSIAVRWTAETIRHPDGNTGRMPPVNCISGCGMWRLYRMEDRGRLHAWDPTWIRLSGIEHHVASKKFIKGTLIRRVVDLIRIAHSDLRTSIELTLPA